MIDLSAGPCTYGKIETEEGSVSSRTLPRLRNVMFPRGVGVASDPSSRDNFVGQLAAVIGTTVEHVIAPDVRYWCQIMREYVYDLHCFHFVLVGRIFLSFRGMV